MAEQDTMLHWIAETCRAARREAGRKQVHVAASADVDQSTVNRFEQGIAWPRNADRIIAAYADDLDVTPMALWENALRRWRESDAGQDFATALQAGASQPENVGALPAAPARDADDPCSGR